MIFRIMAKKVRANMLSDDTKRDSGLEIPQDVAVYDDISYGPHGKANLLCVMRPEASNKVLPCIVNFHGGGFFYGSKETYQFYCASLAQRGFAVINFNYRLSPENKFPKQLRDCIAVLKWICEKVW